MSMSPAAALAPTPFHAAVYEITTWQLMQACHRARAIEGSVEIARFLRAALRHASATSESATSERLTSERLTSAGIVLALASGALRTQAAEPHATVDVQAEKRNLAEHLDRIIEQISAISAIRSQGQEEAHAEEAHAEEAQEAQDAQAREICVAIAAHLADIRASLKGKWGAPKAHNAMAEFLIDDVETDLARSAKNAPIFEIDVVTVYRVPVTIGACFIVPRSFAKRDANGAVNGAVGPNAFLFQKADKAEGAASWVPLTLSPVRNTLAATVRFYRALYDAVSRPDIIWHIRTILLAALEAPDAIGSAASPWHQVITDGTFRLVPLIHEQHLSTTGLAANQLAIVPASLTPELAQTMRAIAANITPKPEAETDPEAETEPAPRYFTIAPTPAAGAKRKLSDSDSEGDEAPL
jgi:hypothetical protein